MTTLQTYKGLEVLPQSPSPQPGGAAISDNFRSLVDWGPKSAYVQSVNPQSSNDVDENYQAGSVWQNTDELNTTLFVCRDPGSSGQNNAVWDQVIVLSAETGVAVVGEESMSTAPSSYKLGVHAQSSTSDTLVISNDGAQCRNVGIHFKSATFGDSNSFSSGRILSGFDTNGCSSNPGFPGAYLVLQSPSSDNTFKDVLTVRNERVGIGTTAPLYPLSVIRNSQSCQPALNVDARCRRIRGSILNPIAESMSCRSRRLAVAATPLLGTRVLRPIQRDALHKLCCGS